MGGSHFPGVTRFALTPGYHLSPLQGDYYVKLLVAGVTRFALIPGYHLSPIRAIFM